MKSWYLLAVAWIAIVAWIVWTWRQRKARQLRATEERMQQFLVAPVAGAATVRPASPATAVAATPAAISRYVARDRILDAREKVLLFLMRTELPDHEVLARLNLATILDAGTGPAGFERDQRQRRIAGEDVDFVVCDKNFRPLVAVDVATPGEAAESALKVQCLAEAGVRYVVVPADKLPVRGTLRARLFGTAQ